MKDPREAPNELRRVAELMHRVCEGRSPKQAVGEMLAAFLERGEWAVICAALAAPDAPADPAPPAAWIWKYANGEEEVVFVDAAKIDWDPESMDVPQKVTPLYAAPAAEQAVPVADAWQSTDWKAGYAAALHDRRQAVPVAPTEMKRKRIFEIADRDECSPDDRGWGPKFSIEAFARALIAERDAQWLAAAPPTAPAAVPQGWKGRAQVAPAVPAHIIRAITAYGDARADDVGSGDALSNVIWQLREQAAPTIYNVNDALDRMGGMNIPHDPHERLGWLHDFAIALAAAPAPTSGKDGTHD